ncbi:hypothetical protein GCM10023081_11580 [Arthrobacter ginkgonis]|uniref:Rv3660c-like CheY-like N-terminal domain-containing protein n=1 Tax=Arthrobacter ginkgonis TaxID=1630594 RepID=A0ABP7C2Z3_9MICC
MSSCAPSSLSGAPPRPLSGAAAQGSVEAGARTRGSGHPEAQDEGDGCLLATRDDALADAVALVAAAAGVRLSVLGDVPPPGTPASALLLGPDFAGAETPGWDARPVVLLGHPPEEDLLWRVAAQRPGVRVAVLPRAAAWLGEYLGELGLRGGTGRVLVLAGAAGGTGTSTLAALAAGASSLAGARTVLIDADPHSCGVWPMLKPRIPDGVGWEDLGRSSGQLPPAQLAEVLPLAQGAAVLTWSGGTRRADLPPGLLGEVVSAARRVFDEVVVDAGRTAGIEPALATVADAGLAVLPAGRISTSVLGVRSGIDRGGAPAGFRAGDPFGGTGFGGEPWWQAAVVGRLGAGMDARRVAAAAGLPLGGYLPWLRSVARSAQEGRLITALARRRVRAPIEELLRRTRTDPAQAA